MAVILPLIAPENESYRLPDSSYMTPPAALPGINYFISASKKNFIYKSKGEAATLVTIDFPAVDNLFRLGTGNNITFKTV